MRTVTKNFVYLLMLALVGCGGGGGAGAVSNGGSSANISERQSVSSLTLSSDSYGYAVGQNITLNWTGVNLTNCSFSGANSTQTITASGSLVVAASSSGDKIFSVNCSEKAASVAVKVLDGSISIPDTVFADALNRLGYPVVNGRVSASDLLRLKKLCITSMQGYYGTSDQNNTSIFSNTSVPDYGVNCAYTSGYIQDISGIESMLNLESFRIEHQRFSLINISPLKNLSFFSLWGNPIQVIDLSSNTALRNVGLSETSLRSVDFSNLNLVEEIVVSNQEGLSRPYTKQNGTVVYGMASVDVSSNLNLKRLYVQNVGLTNVVFPRNNSLQEFWGAGNMFSSLDLSGMSNLSYVILYDSPILENINIKGIAQSGVPSRLITTNSPNLRQIKVTSVQAIQDKIAEITASTPAGQTPALGLYWDSWTSLVNAP
jgi:uncharacterized protein YjbI with pentapeptide repeats